jgi:predicted ATPase
VLAVARPEVHEIFPRLFRGLDATELRLGVLRPRAAAQLVAHALGDGVDAATTARIVERSGGNPFYLEELLRAVAEGHGDELPETVVAMAAARLEVLDPSARRVLRAASVFGESFGAAHVGALLDPELR